MNRLISVLRGTQAACNFRETGAGRSLFGPNQIHDPLDIMRKNPHAPVYERAKDCRR